MLFEAGVVSYCAREAIELLAYSPLGGPRRIGGVAADAVLAAIASELDVTPLQVVLAWLRTLAPVVVPIPGATRAETAVSAVQGQLLELKDEQRQALDEHFHPAVASRTSTRPPRPRSAALGEVVLVHGIPRRREEHGCGFARR